MKNRFLILCISLAFCLSLFSGCKMPPNVETSNEKTATITFSHNNACQTSGGDLTQTILKSEKFEDITISPYFGYKFDSYEIKGKKYYNANIKLQDFNEDVNVKVNLKYSTYELPVVNITANEQITSKYDYVDMTFSLENCSSELKNVTGGIRLRGNHTMTQPKKPYRIKFDKKQSLFGLPSAKSWVLLADYFDPSTLHNHTALTLAKMSDGFEFIPTSHKVNVYLNGEFMGLYVLCEQVQENAGRMDIEMETDENDYISTSLTNLFDYNFFISMDKSAIEDEDAVEGETYFKLTCKINGKNEDRWFELKYPEKSSFASATQFNKFFNDLKNYTATTMELLNSGTYSQVNSALHLDSLTDYYIIDSIMRELDHTWKSFHMYHKAGEEKLRFGPIWDYDWSLGVRWVGPDGAPNTDYPSDVTEWSTTSPFYKMLEKFNETRTLIKNHYNSCYKTNLQNYINNYDNMVNSFATSLALNNQKWYSDTSKYDHNITNANIDYLKRHLIGRKQVLDNFS